MLSTTNRTAAITVAGIQLLFWVLALEAACLYSQLAELSGTNVIVVIVILAINVWFQIVIVVGVLKKSLSFVAIWCMWAVLHLAALISIIPMFAVRMDFFQNSLAIFHPITSYPLIFYGVMSFLILAHCIFSWIIARYAQNMTQMDLDLFDSQTVHRSFAFKRFRDGEYQN